MADRTPEVYLREHPNPHLRQYRSPRRQQVRPVIVVHTAENLPDTVATAGGAEAVAGFISRRTDPGSYHSLVDSDSLVRLVRYTDEAWHDGTGSNPWSLGLSIATTAAWWPLAPRAWRDGAVEQAAQEAARMARFVHAETGAVVQPQRITRAQSENGGSGFISHAERDPKRRTDPGAAFPWAQFLARYAALIADLLGGTVPPGNGEEFVMDAEAKAEFAAIRGEVEALRNEVEAVRSVQLIHVDENRKQYGSLRGWCAATAEAVGTLLSPVKTYKQMRQRAGELDTTTHPET